MLISNIFYLVCSALERLSFCCAPTDIAMQQHAPRKLVCSINKANNNYLGTQIESLMSKPYNCNQLQRFLFFFLNVYSRILRKYLIRPKSIPVQPRIAYVNRLTWASYQALRGWSVQTSGECSTDLLALAIGGLVKDDGSPRKPISIAI